MNPPLIPELDVTNLNDSLVFYVDTCGFEKGYERLEEKFVYLQRGNIHLMLEEAADPGRRFATAELQRPFGRGVNLQIQVPDIDDLHSKIKNSVFEIVIPLEDQ